MLILLGYVCILVTIYKKIGTQACLFSLYFKLQGLCVNSSHVSDEVENLVRVTNLIVVPANNLNEGVSE